ncbi:hypothetical protein LPJ55_000343 [Coemansia sp. RSA 990]|nr:hypothetical protein LPJ68_001062 [Coemansia sp. RSA 1086]KAJ1875929.1 hypothetical protein LPJ55_000343 [Coemansia sp. RSA 990]KAJ2676965.1 hypothetical protein IWW42_000303 [Coemansia sp. RSA 1085]
MSLLHLDPVAFGKAADQTLLQQQQQQQQSNNSASPICNPVTPISTQSPYTAAKNESLGAGYPESTAAWQQSASGFAKNIDGVDMSSNYNMDGSLSGDIAVMAYPTPNQSISLKTSSVGNPLESTYANAGLMLDTSALAAQHGGDISSTFTAPLSGVLPTTSSFSEFATAATTPTGNNSAHSSPSSRHNHLNMSQTSIMHVPALHSLSDIPPASAGIVAPISRPLDMLAGASDINTRVSLSNQPPPSTSLQMTGNAESGFSSIDSSGYGICEDHALNSIAYWDENSYVCIPSMENLRIQLNSLGMTANHTDSLQKNFNDYQFKRQTDQRRIRHTSEQSIVKFSNENFLPGRSDLLHRVVRKSALKKMQTGGGTRDRASGSGSARKKPRVPSIRQGNTRSSRQSTSERINPYTRYAQAEAGQMPNFHMPISPTSSFQPHQGTASSAVPPLYSSAESSGLVMPLSNLGFNIQHTMPIPERSEHGLIPASNGNYSQAPFYMASSSSGFIPSLMQAPPQVSLPSSLQGQYPTPLPPSQNTPHMLPHLPPPLPHSQAQPLEYQAHHANNSTEDYYHGHNSLSLHPPHMQQPHQYQLFASSGDMPSHPTPPRGIDSGSHPA